ncbi:MAG: hypothetical protein HRT99_03145 [Mycoplasmatales bacterium]|nr:hypothetical protein [Mycoplasmatales bacterium]
MITMIILSSLNLSGIYIPKQAFFQVSMIPVYTIGGLIGSFKYKNKKKSDNS